MVQKVEHKAGEVESDDLIVFSAWCCEINSCYCKMPECCGCYNSSVCCCLKADNMACKPSNVKGECCIICSGGQLCIMPTTCVKGTNQCCCCDTRCAFPCDHDVPCVIAFCFCVCCVNFSPKCGCFQKLGTYTKAKPAEGPKYQEREMAPRSASPQAAPVAYAQPYPPQPSQGYAQTSEAYPQPGPKSYSPSHDPYADQRHQHSGHGYESSSQSGRNGPGPSRGQYR